MLVFGALVHALVDARERVRDVCCRCRRRNACPAGLGCVVVVLAVGPWITLGKLVFGGLTYGVFGIPIGGLVLRFVWVQAYPDRTTDPIET